MVKQVLPEPESSDGDIRVTWAHPPQHLLPPCLRVETHPDGDRVTVTVSGELDIDTEQALHEALREALHRSVSGVDVDLDGVDFCDCSGLNVLLCVRRQALEDAKTLTIGSTGPSVDRLLSLTDTRALFGPAGTTAAPAADGRDGQPREGHGPARQDEGPDAIDRELHIELVQLRRALQTRPVIDLARGVLMASFALSAQDAWSVLVTVSQNTNTKLHQVAEDLVAAVSGDAPPGRVRQELAAAVTAVKEPSGADPDQAVSSTVTPPQT